MSVICDVHAGNGCHCKCVLAICTANAAKAQLVMRPVGRPSLLLAPCCWSDVSNLFSQVNVQSLTDQTQAIADAVVQGQQQGSSRLDKAVEALLFDSQQECLQGSFHGRLHSLAVVPAADDSIAVNSVLKELCNLVSTYCHEVCRHSFGQDVVALLC